MQRAFKPSEMRYQRPERLSDRAAFDVTSMRQIRDDMARSKVFRQVLNDHGKEFLAAEEILTANVSRFVFLASVLNQKNKPSILPILKEYSLYPGFSVVEENGLVRAKCKYQEAMKVPAEQYMALEHRL